MKSKIDRTELVLEDRLFKNILYLGILCIFLLIFYDSLFTRDYHSVIIELAALVFFLGYLYLFKIRPIKAYHRYLFSLLLFCFINLGWITGSGINLLNVSLYFLCLGIILIINDKKWYVLIFIIVVVDLLVLFIIQYYTDWIVIKDYATARQYLINDFITALFFIFISGYLIVFLKLNYNKERSNLNEANILLKDKSIEISYQNEELQMSKDVLDQTIVKLEDQTKKLMNIQGTLEEKVKERTNDLMKLNERLIAQNQQLEQYAYITSHNLRAPITQIKGLIQVLPQGNNLDQLTLETLKRIGVSAINLEKVFADLSEIIRVEQSMQQPWQNIDLFAEITGVVDSLRSSIDSKHIQITLPAHQDVMIKALRPYVYSVFHNIIENAVKYSDDAKQNPFIKIEISDVSKYYVVSITDNGIGIDMDMASGKVFQMYQRFNNTHPGQGFGLFLVKSQMEAMQGKVELESILGHGTTFNLYFAKH